MTNKNNGRTRNAEEPAATSTRKVATAIQAVRNTLEKNPGYVTSEIRTKQVIVDPILRALGWNTGDPAQVRIEYRTSEAAVEPTTEADHRTKITGYALFQNNRDEPLGLLEAKTLPKAELEALMLTRKERDPAKAFQELRERGDITERSSPLLDAETLNNLKETDESELEGTIRKWGITGGFAVHTNGADWYVYDLRTFDLGKGCTSLREARITMTNILTDTADRAAVTLHRVRHLSRWPKGSAAERGRDDA